MAARHRPDDPPVTINTTPFEKNELPRVIGDYEIAIDDHSYMPTDLVRQCKNLKHIVFLGTGAASYMNVAELEAPASRSTPSRATATRRWPSRPSR